MPTKQRLPFYDFSRLLSHNAVFNFCVGARGLGKTYGAKKLVIRNYLRKGDEFIYLRRYNTELKTRNNFFADIAHEFPQYLFRVQGSMAQVCKNPDAPDKERTWETMGYFIALSNAQSKKSVAYPKVTIIIYDEFIIERGVVHYLSNETQSLLDFYSTVDRYRDKTRVLFLANSLSIMNPYFLDYDIRPSGDDELIVKNDGFIAAHFPNSSDFKEAVYETRFGKFIQNTSYGDYSIGSQFRDNSDHQIDLKTPGAEYVYTLHTRRGTFSIWAAYNEGRFFVQEKRPKNEIMYTLEIGAVTNTMQLLTKNDKLLSIIRNAYGRGVVFFSSPQVREAFAEMYRGV